MPSSPITTLGPGTSELFKGVLVFFKRGNVRALVKSWGNVSCSPCSYGAGLFGKLDVEFETGVGKLVLERVGSTNLAADVGYVCCLS